MSQQEIFNNERFLVEEKNFGELKKGDFVYGANNEPVEIVGVSEKHVPETMFEVKTEDGVLNTSGTHLWYVVTENDRNFHNERKNRAKKIIPTLLKDKYVLKTLESFADNVYKKDESIEITVVDMLALMFNSETLDFTDSNVLEVASILDRIALSIGVTTETNVEYRDLNDSNDKEFQKIDYYDARLFAQQILAISGLRKYRKKYKVIVGQVVSTEKMKELLDNGVDVYIP